jgi:hypothetical protein
VAVILAAVAAYAFSFALDLLLGGLMGVYPSTAFLPVVTWSVVATVLLILAARTTHRRAWLAFPFVAFGLLALLGGLVGNHPHSYGVAAVMVIQALILWRVFSRTISVAR